MQITKCEFLKMLGLGTAGVAGRAVADDWVATAKSGKGVRQVDVAEVRRVLQAQGAYLG